MVKGVNKMTKLQKVQAVLQGGKKYTESEIAEITNIPVMEVSLIVKQIPGIAYKDFEYYLPQHNGQWLIAIGSLIFTFGIMVVTGL
jgi:hypothetical protein